MLCQVQVAGRLLAAYNQIVTTLITGTEGVVINTLVASVRMRATRNQKVLIIFMPAGCLSTVTGFGPVGLGRPGAS